MTAVCTLAGAKGANVRTVGQQTASVVDDDSARLPLAHNCSMHAFAPNLQPTYGKSVSGVGWHAVIAQCTAH